MTTRKSFPQAVLAKIETDRILGIRAGKDASHRVIGIWAVVVKGRVFVRSWSLKPRSWWRAFLADPHGIITVGDREIPIRARPTRSETLKDAVSKAYREKYNRPGDVQYVKDMSRKKSRDTTTELVPLG